MAIRCASKAIIVENGAVLLNRCKCEDGSIYYDLPGGGQKLYESLEQALIREVKEETGYDVCVNRFAALVEEINTNTDLREKYPEYTHRILHIFMASIIGNKNENPIEKDFCMEESVWVPLESIDSISETRPYCLKKILCNLPESDSALYFGTEYFRK